jgi:hypothetical protein
MSRKASPRELTRLLARLRKRNPDGVNEDVVRAAFLAGLKAGRDALAPVLKEFCDDVEAAGGCFYEDGVPHVNGDEEWTDLAYTYLNACKALGRKPLI